MVKNANNCCSVYQLFSGQNTSFIISVKPQSRKFCTRVGGRCSHMSLSLAWFCFMIKDSHSRKNKEFPSLVKWRILEKQVPCLRFQVLLQVFITGVMLYDDLLTTHMIGFLLKAGLQSRNVSILWCLSTSDSFPRTIMTSSNNDSAVFTMRSDPCKLEALVCCCFRGERFRSHKSQSLWPSETGGAQRHLNNDGESNSSDMLKWCLQNWSYEMWQTQPWWTVVHSIHHLRPTSNVRALHIHHENGINDWKHQVLFVSAISRRFGLRI